jgi:hypothetical protein
MNSEVYLLKDQIDDVKTKLTDNEYKSILDTLKKIHDKYQDVEEDENYHVVPKMYTDEWYRLSLEEQTRYSGNQYYEEWIWDHLTEQDIQWYKSHLDEVPDHLKEHPSIYPEANCCSECTIQSRNFLRCKAKRDEIELQRQCAYAECSFQLSSQVTQFILIPFF